MRRSLNLRVGDAEHAWLKASASLRGMTVTELVKEMVREHMKREIAEAAIARALRCAWEGCVQRPAQDGGDRPGLCIEHQKLAEERVRETRRARRKAS